MTDREFIDLSRAAALYIQKGNARWPQRDESAIAKEFGDRKAMILMNQIEELAEEMRTIEVDMSEHSLGSASDVVREETRKRYPKLSGETLDVLAWKWAFENR